MRRKPHQAFPWRGDDALLLELAMPPENRFFYIWWSRAHDRGTDRTRRSQLPADRFEAVGEQRRHGHRALMNLVDADLEQEIDRRTQSVNAVRIQRAGLETAATGDERRAGVDELSLSFDVRPADFEHVELLAHVRGDIEDARPFRAAHPLVAVGGEEMDLRFVDVGWQHADALNRVDRERDVLVL